MRGLSFSFGIVVSLEIVYVGGILTFLPALNGLYLIDDSRNLDLVSRLCDIRFIEI